MRRQIRDVRIVDPKQGMDQIGDIVIEEGTISAIGESAADRTGEGIDGRGLTAVAGFIDLHVHLREPGEEYKETIATGSAAAAAGGFTGIACMANTSPPNDSAAVTEFIINKAAQANKARVYPIGCITKGMRGEELAEIGEMVRAGAVAISDDGRPVDNPNVMRRAMEYSRQFDIPVIEHCETPQLHPGGVMHEGYWSTRLGLAGIPASSETISVQRNIELATATGARFHVAHLSTRAALQAVRAAKQAHLPVSCEVTPHHLVLTDSAVEEYDTNAKMKPPLCSEQDRAALVQGLVDGTVDTIATDHAPHHHDEKDQSFDEAPFGIVGLETAASLILDRFVSKGIIPLSRMIELLSIRPAEILAVPGGSLAVGQKADIALLDLEASRRVEPSMFQSKARNSPFAGWRLKGLVRMTLMNGDVTWTASDELE